MTMVLAVGKWLLNSILGELFSKFLHFLKLRWQRFFPYPVVKINSKKISEKLVSLDFVEKSGLTKDLQNNGYKVCWSSLAKVATRELDGWEVVVYFDKKLGEEFKLTTGDLVFMKKKG